MKETYLQYRWRMFKEDKFFHHILIMLVMAFIILYFVSVLWAIIYSLIYITVLSTAHNYKDWRNRENRDGI